MVENLNEPDEEQMPIGMHVIPDTGRQFYWTGKIAIGILHQPARSPMTDGELIMQALMLATPPHTRPKRG